MRKYILLFFLVTVNIVIKAQQRNTSLPISTEWSVKGASVYNSDNALLKVYLIKSKRTNTEGTGFLLKSGYVITNNHVIAGSKYTDLVINSPDGNVYPVKNILTDSIRDLAVLELYNKVKGGFELADNDSIKVGTKVYTWGYPLGYDGPSPLISVGYLAGFRDARFNKYDKPLKHLVVNGAFNSGNSGGPLFDEHDKICGIVQSKKLPNLSNYSQSAIEALKKNPSGAQYNNTDSNGKQSLVSEAQIIAQILIEYQEMGQVMIGEAIEVSELKAFLSEHKISY